MGWVVVGYLCVEVPELFVAGLPDNIFVSPQRHFEIDGVFYTSARLMLPNLIKLCRVIGSFKVAYHSCFARDARLATLDSKRS